MLDIPNYRELVASLKTYYGGDQSTGQMISTVGHILKKRGLHHDDRVNWSETYSDIISEHPRKFGFPDVSDFMKRINANIIQKSENYNTLTGQDIDGWWRCAACHGKGGFMRTATDKRTGQEYEGVVDCVKCHTTGYANPGECGCELCAGAKNEFVRSDTQSFDESIESIRDTDPEAYAFIVAMRRQKPKKRRKAL